MPAVCYGNQADIRFGATTARRHIGLHLRLVFTKVLIKRWSIGHWCANRDEISFVHRCFNIFFFSLLFFLSVFICKLKQVQFKFYAFFTFYRYTVVPSKINNFSRFNISIKYSLIISIGQLDVSDNILN